MSGRPEDWGTHGPETPMPGLWKNKDDIWQIAKTVNGRRIRKATGTRCYATAVQQLYHVIHRGLSEEIKTTSLPDQEWVSRINGLAGASWLGAMHARCRNSAAKRNIPWRLSREELKALVLASKGVCALSGIAFEFSCDNDLWRRSPYGPSLDRITSSDTYHLANCRIISNIANCALNEWGDGVLMKFAAGVMQRHGHRLSEFL